jgi:hypothetical protein
MNFIGPSERVGIKDSLPQRAAAGVSCVIHDKQLCQQRSVFERLKEWPAAERGGPCTAGRSSEMRETDHAETPVMAVPACGTIRKHRFRRADQALGACQAGEGFCLAAYNSPASFVFGLGFATS